MAQLEEKGYLVFTFKIGGNIGDLLLNLTKSVVCFLLIYIQAIIIRFLFTVVSWLPVPLV